MSKVDDDRARTDTVVTNVSAEVPTLPEGVLRVRLGPGANCSSAGSAIDVLFYGSVIVGALAVALAAAFPPEPRAPGSDDEDTPEAPPPPAPDPPASPS
jgi:hypothetical protein